MDLHRKAVGDIEVTALYDGFINMPPTWIQDMPGEEFERRLGLTPGQQGRITVNSFLLKLGDAYAMVDAGSGPTMGPNLGLQPDSLRAAGVQPEEIRAVFLTHFHPDHSNGLIDAAGTPIYPNAEIYAHEREEAFWLNDLPAGVPDMATRVAGNIRNSAKAYADRLHWVREGEVTSGVAAVPLPGHTPGHTGWLVRSRGEGLIVWGDLIHVCAIQVETPEAVMTFDIDQESARMSRRRGLDMVATDRLAVAGAHLDFPGFGTIERKGTGYRYVPG